MAHQLFIDDPLRVNPAAIKIVAIDRATGVREIITHLSWFKYHMVESMVDDRLYEFEVTLHDPSSL